MTAQVDHCPDTRTPRVSVASQMRRRPLAAEAKKLMRLRLLLG